ncbi:RNA-binding transcriptional accessory protein, partial [Micromonospora chalcea]
LAVRIDDARPKVVVATSCGIEGDRVVPYQGGGGQRGGSGGGQGGGGQRGGGQGGAARGGPQQRPGRGGGGPAPVNDAMAEALRRAGLA